MKPSVFTGNNNFLLGILLTIACLVFFFFKIDLEGTIETMSNFNWIYLVFGFLALAIGYTARIFRWSLMLKANGYKTSALECCPPFLGSITLNNVLPLRFGDVVRALIFPASMGISKTVATSSLILERLADAMMLLACLTLAAVTINELQLPGQLKFALVFLTLFGSLAFFVAIFLSRDLSLFFHKKATLLESALLARVLSMLGNLLSSFQHMSRSSNLLSLFSTSIVVWAGEVGLFHCVFKGLDIASHPMQSLFIMAIATLSTLIPSSPGYLGTFHMATFSALSSTGYTTTEASSFAITVHLALWVPTTLAGIIAIYLSPKLFEFRKLKQQTK